MKEIRIRGCRASRDGGLVSLANERAAICPRPRIFKENDLVLVLEGDVTVEISDGEIRYIAEQLSDELVFHGVGNVNIVLEKHGNDDTGGLNSQNDFVFAGDEEGFHLEAGDHGIDVIASTNAGLFYGVQLLYQLLVKDDDDQVLVVGCIADDAPLMRIRGVSQDISRGQSPSVEALKRHLRLLSRFRVNLYQFYIEDMFKFDAFPQVGKGRGPLTREAIKEIQEFAKRYHVEVMPIFQTLGHMENMLIMPEFMEYAEFPGANSLNLGHPRLHDLLGKMLAEVATAFESPSFHIGCDETWDVGKFNGKAFVEEKEMGNALLEHYTWVIKELKKHGKKRFFLYHDIAAKYDEVLQGLPRDGLVMVYWDYSARNEYPLADRIASFGIDFVVSSSCLCWVRPYPDLKGAFESNEKLINHGLQKGAIGQINSAWGDNGQENFHENNILPFCYSAAYSWNREGFDRSTFMRAFSQAVFGFQDPRFEELQMKCASVNHEFPPFFISKWLPLHWRHPYHSPAMDNDHPFFDEEENMEINPNLVYHEDSMEENRKICDEIIRLAGELKPLAKRNAFNIDYLEYVGHVMLYFIDKIQTTAKVTNLCLAGLSEENVAEIERLVNNMISSVKDIKSRFGNLWLHCAGFPMLDRINQFYDWQVMWHQDKLDQVKAGIPWKNPYVESEWIAFEREARHQEPRYFRKELFLEPDEFDAIERAHVELMAGAHARLWLNGEEVGQVPFAPDGHALLFDHEVEAWDVKRFLKPGKNVIAAMARVHFGGNPVLNVYGEIKLVDGRMVKILTDTSWLATDQANERWFDHDVDLAGWKQAVSKGRPPKYMGEVTLPRFDLGLKSKHTHGGYGRIIRDKARMEDLPSEFYDDFYFYNGNII